MIPLLYPLTEVIVFASNFLAAARLPSKSKLAARLLSVIGFDFNSLAFLKETAASLVLPSSNKVAPRLVWVR